MDKILPYFEMSGGTYTKVGDYNLPNLSLMPEKDTRPIGIWGCGCPVNTSAQGRSTDRADRRDNDISDIYSNTKKRWLFKCN